MRRGMRSSVRLLWRSCLEGKGEVPFCIQPISSVVREGLIADGYELRLSILLNCLGRQWCAVYKNRFLTSFFST